MIITLLAVVVLALGIIGLLIALGTYTDIAPPRSTRSFAITPIVIVSAFIGLVGAADGPGAAFFLIMFVGAIYVIGYIANGFSTTPLIQ